MNDFRYSALGVGEFCEIHPRPKRARDSEAQGVTVTQQASGLLCNARGVKPLWKISALALIFIILFIANLSAESPVEIDLKPVKKIKKINSLALFRFDGKLINSGRINLIDYLDISYDYYRYLLKKFSSIRNIKITDTEKIISFSEEDEIKTLRSDDVAQYDEKIFSRSTVISKNPVKAIDAFLYGRINKYYKGRTFETSYIDITIYLVNSKSKVIYWTTGIRGCLEYVSDALINIITKGSYKEPTSIDIKRFGWVNPYKSRVKSWAFQYRPGYLIMIGEISDKVDNGFSHNFAMNFKLPVWGEFNIYNQIELSLITSFDTIEENNPIKNNIFNTFIPVMFNFLYMPGELINVKNLTPVFKAGLGLSYNEIYYSGLYPHVESITSFKAVINLGIGAEYALGALELFDYRFRTDKLALLTEINFLKWIGTAIGSNALNLSLGLKYYF